MNTSNTIELNGAQKRFLSGYKHSMKKRVMFHLEKITSECNVQTIEQKHIMSAISRAYVDYTKEEGVVPSNTLNDSMLQYREGKWKSSKELLDELRSEVPQSC